MQETQIRSLVWEDHLEEEMTTHSSILAWEIPQTEEPGRLQSMGSQKSQHDLATKQQQQTSWSILRRQKLQYGPLDYITSWPLGFILILVSLVYVKEALELIFLKLPRWFQGTGRAENWIIIIIKGHLSKTMVWVLKEWNVSLFTQR